MPLISVLLATNKLDEYLWPAIDSILNQIDISFELIVVVNGPDYFNISKEISRRLAMFDNVMVITTPIPQLAYALNLGLSTARAEYIARMDADDIATPERLAFQYEYMITNNLDCVGTNVFVINADGVVLGQRHYPRGEKINQLLPLKNCFCHPSMMFRKDVLFKARGYNSGFNTEDYDLWLRLLRVGVNWDNIDRPLLYYRVHQSSAQGTRLAYSECLALSVREFFLDKSLVRFLAMFAHAFKFIYRRMR